MESEMMTMIREVRNDNSARHAKMTIEERLKESDEVIRWFEKRTGKKVRAADTSMKQIKKGA